MMEPIAIRLSQQATLAKSLVMSGHPIDDRGLSIYRSQLIFLNNTPAIAEQHFGQGQRDQLRVSYQ